MISLVYSLRKAANASWESAISTGPLSIIGPDDIRFFLKWNLTYCSGSVMQRIIGWGHADLIFRTRGMRVNLFVDCTFGIVQHGFSQLMIIMIYSPAHDLYVPIFSFYYNPKIK